MDFKGWTIVRKLGQGGQGEVSLVLSPTRSSDKNQAIQQILAALEVSSAHAQTGPDRRTAATGLANAIQAYSRADAPNELGALKQYKIPAAEDGQQARQRFVREVETLRAVSHPNLLRLIDADVEADWMITQFYEGLTLQDNRDIFKNNPLDALNAYRGLVEGVAKLHEAQAVHRDIKPPNIFIDHGRLVLGDFGIVFTEEGRQRRFTETFERVGTRDWMPPWAHTGIRVDEVKASFDVFSLGKVLWAMLSGKEMLPLWYFAKPNYDLRKLFPNSAAAMQVINDRILAACVVENEEDCLPDAVQLLIRVDEAIDAIRRDRQALGDTMRCQVCAPGRYTLLYPGDQTLRVFVLPPKPPEEHGISEQQLVNRRNGLTVRSFRCDHCGNLALFHVPEGEPLPGWKSVRRTDL